MIELSLQQFALAVGAAPKWVLNARPRLGRPIAYTVPDAQWLRLARCLNRDLRIPLRTAADLAVQALTRRAGNGGTTGARVVDVRAEGVRLTVDLERQRAAFETALSAAIAFGNPKRPGRKRRPPQHFWAAIGRAWRAGIAVGPLRARFGRPAAERLAELTAGMGGMRDVPVLLQRLAANRVRAVVVGEVAEFVVGAIPPPDPTATSSATSGARAWAGARMGARTGARTGARPHPPAGLVGRAVPGPVLELCYDPSPANLRRLATALRELDARPRASQCAPECAGASVPDLLTLRSTDALALSTPRGAVNLRRHLPGVGDFDAAVRHSTPLDAFGIETRVLELPALARLRDSAGTRADIERLPVLETVLALPALQAHQREIAARRIRWTGA
jgi:hypothetical protein